MKATLPTTDHRNAKNLSGDKETAATYNAVAYDRALDQIRTYATARIYVSRSTGYSGNVMASIWVYSPTLPHTISGHGRATGHGYHKASAALQAAITSAGVTLSEDIDGRGDSAMEAALRAIAIAAGADPLTVTII